MKSNYGAADWSFRTRGKVPPPATHPTPPPRIVWLGVAALGAQEGGIYHASETGLKVDDTSTAQVIVEDGRKL